MEFKEVEFKYNASSVGLTAFINLMEAHFPNARTTLVSSYDDYYINANNEFIRHRYNNNMSELTIKRKTTEANNNERIEINLPIHEKASTKLVEPFLSLLDYKFNFGIYKTSKIYWVDKSVFAYYVVYDKNMTEIGRFIEIEADEALEWASEQVALDHISNHEKLLEPLAIGPRNRLKKSLFEMYRK